jgi:hypothetical protein
MQIFVKEYNTLTFTVNSDDMIDSLRIQIKDRIGCPIEFQRLVYGGKQLEDGHTFAYYGVCREATIHLIFRII